MNTQIEYELKNVLNLKSWHLLQPLPARKHQNETNLRCGFMDIFPMGDLKQHIACVHDKTRYPCQCGKVVSHKDIRLCHQRTCPK